jgi:probable rRNA maturation factor
MEILIDNRQIEQPLEIKTVRRKAQAILNALDCPDGELSIVLVDDAAIAELNGTYLQHQGPTNVISFPMREGDFGEINPHMLGDVVISMDTCAREAKNADLSTEKRLDQLLVHGILHLFGYDHIHSQAQAQIMETESNKLLAMLDKISG